MSNGNCTIGANIKAKVETMEKRFDKTDKTFGRIFDELKEIRDLLTSRPTWTVLAVVSLLSSTTVGLLVTLLRVLKT